VTRSHLALALALASIGACGRKSGVPAPPAPEITGLAAVPASAQVVVGADVGKLIDTPLIARAVDQFLLRDATLADRWKAVHDTCKLDLGKQIKHVMLAIGPRPSGPAGGPGTGPVLMIATGNVVEADLAACVRLVVGQGNGTLTASTVNGRTLYQAKDGNRTMFFAFGRPDTIVFGASEAYVTEALTSAKKVLDDPEMAMWLGKVDQNAPLWSAGRMDPRVGGRLVQLTEQQLSKPPLGMMVTGDLAKGLRLDVTVALATAEDAKKLESFTKLQMDTLAAAAQMMKLGTVVAKLETSVDRDTVKLHADLTVDDLNQVLSALDRGGPPPQDATPPPSGPK
jgi:hypothetical protein